MTILRGVADDMKLIDWLTQAIWPIETAVVCPELVRVGSQHAIAEMIRCGTTCYNDMFFFPDVTAQVRGMRYKANSGLGHRVTRVVGIWVCFPRTGCQ